MMKTHVVDLKCLKCLSMAYITIGEVEIRVYDVIKLKSELLLKIKFITFNKEKDECYSSEAQVENIHHSNLASDLSQQFTT